MKLTKTNLIDFKNQSDSALTKYVCDYILSEWDDEHEEDNKNILLEVINFGCANGTVSGFVYTSDILNFYNDFKDEIYALFIEVLDSCGCKDAVELFGKNWDYADPLAFYDYNKQVLARLGFEETIKNIANKFDIEW